MSKLSFLILMLLLGNVYAQKLPNVQKASLRAPGNVKIDGKANEWGKMQAYNSAIDCSYTIANDDKKLYLVVQASGNVINNIINGGVKIGIQKNGSRNDLNAPFIKFPYLKNVRAIVMLPKDWIHPNADTVMMLENKKLNAAVKWVYTSGIKGADSLISIYNDEGIAVANAFDIDRTYTCEFGIDLKLFGLSVNDLSKFNYHITINGEPNKYTSAGLVDFTKNVLKNNFRDGSLTDERLNYIGEKLQQSINITHATTDFWGEYSLVK